MALYRLADPSEPLVAPVLVAAFDGWIDAAGAATTAVEAIAKGGEQLASFENDVLYDYRSRRPVLDIVDGTLSHLTWFDLSLTRTRRGERDVLVLTGAEPDFRWRELATDLSDLCLRVGVLEWISVGAIPAAVPHTRPVPILGTSSKPGLLGDDVRQGPEGLLRVPSAALSVVELGVTSAGIPAVGFYAQVPHYVNGPYAAASIALLGHVERHLGVEIPTGDLAQEALAQRERIDKAVASDESAAEYLDRLESMAEGEQASGAELISEIERFLRGEDH
jgi:hypothetical protein